MSVCMYVCMYVHTHTHTSLKLSTTFGTPWGWYKCIEKCRSEYNMNIVKMKGIYTRIYIYMSIYTYLHYIYILCIVGWNENYIQDASYIYKKSKQFVLMIPQIKKSVFGFLKYFKVASIFYNPLNIYRKNSVQNIKTLFWTASWEPWRQLEGFWEI